MSKYEALINHARKPENQNEIQAETDKTNARKPENQKTRKNRDASFNHARKPENQKTNNLGTENSNKKGVEREVNLSIKVEESRRRHWSAEAKRQGTSITAEIIKALSKRFGEPTS